MAMAVRLVGVVAAGNWSEFFRVLGVGSASIAPESGGGSERDLLVGGELASSSFAVRLRCLCHAMLLPVRAHALRAMNVAYGKSEKVPMVRVCAVCCVLCLSGSVGCLSFDYRSGAPPAFLPTPFPRES